MASTAAKMPLANLLGRLLSFEATAAFVAGSSEGSVSKGDAVVMVRSFGRPDRNCGRATSV
jgi:hypothetical protein